MCVCSGADVHTPHETKPTRAATRELYLRGFVANNLELTQAFATHPQVLVVALNGPAVGLSAAVIGYADFVYAAPHAFLLTPFTSLGLVAEGNTSATFVERLGVSRANEALLMSKRIGCEELAQCGFVNRVFDEVKPGESDKMLGLVLKEVDERLLGGHLNEQSLKRVKALIRKPQKERHESQLVAELMGGLGMFVEGYPQKKFARVKNGEKKHKL